MKRTLLIIIIAAVLSALVAAMAVTQSEGENANVIAIQDVAYISSDGEESTNVNTDFSSESMSSEVSEGLADTEADSSATVEKVESELESEPEPESSMEPETKDELEDTNYYEVAEEENVCPEALYSSSEFQVLGVIYWNGWKWTYYSELVLPGYGLDIPGRHTDDNGYVCDGDGYICLASSVLSRGTIISTPFGKDGKIYDSGCASDVIDVYVSW